MPQLATQTMKQELDGEIAALEASLLQLKMQKLKIDAYRKGMQNLTVTLPRDVAKKLKHVQTSKTLPRTTSRPHSHYLVPVPSPLPRRRARPSPLARSKSLHQPGYDEPVALTPDEKEMAFDFSTATINAFIIANTVPTFETIETATARRKRNSKIADVILG